MQNIDDLDKFGTPTLWEVSSEVLALDATIKPLFTPIALVGTAYTVQCAPGDNLPIHNAIARARTGSILVVATGSDTLRGWWGEVLLEAAVARGIKGLVIDGAVRDTRALRERGFPVFSAGIAIAGTTKQWNGILEQPLAFGGQLIKQGDIIVGDDDGVVVIPPHLLSEVAAKAQARTDKEAAIMENLRNGELTLDLLDLRSLNGASQ